MNEKKQSMKRKWSVKSGTHCCYSLRVGQAEFGEREPA